MDTLSLPEAERREVALRNAQSAMLTSAKIEATRAEVIDLVLRAAALQELDAYELEDENAVLEAGHRLLKLMRGQA